LVASAEEKQAVQTVDAGIAEWPALYSAVPEIHG
jgi:hypothetical protein